jgi:hypothetical protein
MTLESLLDGSPKECFKVTDEDKEWLEMPTVGKELLYCTCVTKETLLL